MRDKHDTATHELPFFTVDLEADGTPYRWSGTAADTAEACRRASHAFCQTPNVKPAAVRVVACLQGTV